MDAKDALGKIAKKIDKEVTKIIERERKVSSSISLNISDIFNHLDGVTMGGKRLRGAFVYFSYLMHGGDDKKDILEIGACIELMHSYLLAHDDVMDRSDLRHSEPTTHIIYKNQARKFGLKDEAESLHFGESIAVNIGDILCHLALYRIMKSDFDAEKKVKALGKLHRQFADTGYGQIIDVFGGILPDVDEDYVMLVHYFKTGKYTYETPLHVGAILGGADDKELAALTRYAIPAGIAFQIQDDILGLFGEEDRIGKSADSDVKEGKKTLLIIKALENANRHQKTVLKQALGNQNLTRPMLEEVRNIVRETGSLEYSQKTALKLVKDSLHGLNRQPSHRWKREGKDFLEAIADYMIKREV